MAPYLRTEWPFGGNAPTEKEACTENGGSARVDKMAYQIRHQIQKMAVELVGSRDEIRCHPEIPVDQPPLIPGVELDDVAIHLRCGDVFGGARRSDFGMIKFSEYRKHISTSARTIGIVTQPFSKKLVRRLDAPKAKACREVTFLLVDYLKRFLPNSTISIRNGENETLPLAYARLAMANQTFTTISSFGIFPVIGTFGEGYFQASWWSGGRAVSPWASHIPAILPNIHEMKAPLLTTIQISRMRLNDTLEWFVS